MVNLKENLKFWITLIGIMKIVEFVSKLSFNFLTLLFNLLNFVKFVLNMVSKINNKVSK